MDMEIITSAASTALANIVLAVIALAGAYAVYYIRLAGAQIKAQTRQIEDKTARELLENALDDVVNLATVSVNAMEQTTAQAIRDKVKEGKVDREELLKLGRDVFREVKKAIAPEAQEVITKNLGSFDAYLTKCIEDAVLKVKRPLPHPLRGAAGRHPGGADTRARPRAVKEGPTMDGATIAMFVFQTVITAIIGIASWGVKNAIGEIKAAISKLETSDKENAAEIAKVAQDLNDLKADLPLIYVTREDFIRVSNNIDNKLDRLLYRSERKEG